MKRTSKLIKQTETIAKHKDIKVRTRRNETVGISTGKLVVFVNLIRTKSKKIKGTTKE